MEHRLHVSSQDSGASPSHDGLARSFFSTTGDDSVHREQVRKQILLAKQATEELNDNTLDLSSHSPFSPSKYAHTVSPSFERFTYCRLRLFRAPATTAEKKSPLQQKKSYWIHPVPAKLSSDHKEEADLLTAFALSPGGPILPKSCSSITLPLEFIPQFFAQFKPDNCKFFSFVLIKNQRQSAYENIYNPCGYRYFYGCEYTDFLQARDANDQPPPNLAELELCQSLMMIESRYPFGQFYHSILTQLFQLIRVKRLELYATNFNGDTSDRGNLKRVSTYDSSAQLGVY